MAGRFRLGQRLGEGGMGVVYAATHIELEQPVAIKILRRELVRHDAITQRMLREAKIVAKLRSEHVARVHDVGRLDDGCTFIVMELLEGADLCNYLAETGRLDVDVAVAFVLQACEAVAEAHAAGIVHRDLKPENLFLTSRAGGTAFIKVLDFGISKELRGKEDTALTNPAAIVGSPDYISPEQMRGETRESVDGRADIWSIGAMLYELLTAERPFAAMTVAEVCARVIHEDPRPLRDHRPELPAGLEAVVLRCLRKRPDERFSTVSDLARALAPYGPPGAVELAERIDRITRRTPVRATPHGLPFGRLIDADLTPIPPGEPSRPSAPSVFCATMQEEAPKPPRRRRRRAAAVTIVASLCLVGAGAAFWNRSVHSRPLVHASTDDPTATEAPAVHEAPLTIDTPVRARSLGIAPGPQPEPPVIAPPRPPAPTAAPPPKAAPAPQPVDSPAPKPVDAWDPNAFGGRR